MSSGIMPPLSGIMHWHSLLARHAKSLKNTLSKGVKALEDHLSGQPRQVLEPVLVRNTPKQPLHPLARIRQSQNRWYSTARKSIDRSIREFSSQASAHASGLKYDRVALPKSKVGTTLRSLSARTPFASTLRPNLTGGTLGRTAGGYTLGGSGRIGGARHFSHTPAAPAQVVHNVSQAMRAFLISGQKAQYDGISTTTGEKRFRAVSTAHDATMRKLQSIPRATPGSRIEFAINPTITAMTPLSNMVALQDSTCSASFNHLNTDGLLDIISVDFSRALKDLSVILSDLRRLAALGDLPITCENSRLCVHFPGCDSQTVSNLCDELQIQRGSVIQDEAFDAFAGTEIALLFPFAPSNHSMFGSSEFDASRPAIPFDDMLTWSQQSYASTSDFEDILNPDLHASPYTSSRETFTSVRSGSVPSVFASSESDPLEYQGFEGIYRFIQELDATRR